MSPHKLQAIKAVRIDAVRHGCPSVCLANVGNLVLSRHLRQCYTVVSIFRVNVCMTGEKTSWLSSSCWSFCCCFVFPHALSCCLFGLPSSRDTCMGLSLSLMIVSTLLSFVIIAPSCNGRRICVCGVPGCPYIGCSYSFDLERGKGEAG